MSSGEAGPRASTRPHHKMMHPFVPIATLTAFEAEAARRGIHPDVLAAILIEYIARDDLFGALLDR